MADNLEGTPEFRLDDDKTLYLEGCWDFAAINLSDINFSNHLRHLTSQALAWDTSKIKKMDSLGALLIWQVWGKTFPNRLHCLKEQRALWQQIAQVNATIAKPLPSPFLVSVGRIGLDIFKNLSGIIVVLGQFTLATCYLLTHPQFIPWKELSANLYKIGALALGILALVGFLIGIVLSYLSAQQLQQYGANILIVNLLGISILRELGPLLAAILIAGRSGSAITAQLGIMKSNQEIDALKAIGISPTVRLAWPKIVSLIISLPLLTLWTDLLALIGGMVSASLELNLSFSQFLNRLPQVVAIDQLIIGLKKSLVFGFLIGLVSCHFGFTVKPTSESLGSATTNSVVTTITLVILADAFFAIILSFAGN